LTPLPLLQALNSPQMVSLSLQRKMLLQTLLRLLWLR
jgi:hypothetical protein